MPTCAFVCIVLFDAGCHATTQPPLQNYLTHPNTSVHSIFLFQGDARDILTRHVAHRLKQFDAGKGAAPAHQEDEDTLRSCRRVGRRSHRESAAQLHPVDAMATALRGIRMGESYLEIWICHTTFPTKRGKSGGWLGLSVCSSWKADPFSG